MEIMVPNGWTKATLGQLCSFSSGHGFSMSDWSEQGLPIIRIQNLNGSRDFNYYAGEPEASWIVEPGELLFAWAGVKGVSFGPTIWSGPRGLLNQHIYRVRPAEGVDRQWLYLCLQLATRHIEWNAHGFKTNLVHVRQTDITGQVCLRPPKEEQVQIARTMACWDDLIHNKAALFDNKSRLRRGLRRQLLAGKRRFTEFVRLAGVHHTPCGELPQDWPLVPLHKVFRVVKRRNGTTIARVLTASGQHGMVDQLDFFNRSVAGRSIEDYYLLRRGEFAYNRSLMNGYPFGAIKRLDRYGEGALSTLYLCFALSRDDCDSDFLLHFFESGLLNRQLRGIAQMGARAHGLLNVTTSDFFDMSMPLPSLPEQKRIATTLNALDREIDLLNRQLELIREQKKGLMQKLLTGEVRVKV